MDLAQFIDLSFLKPDALRVDLERYCTTAKALKVHGVCVHGSRVVLAAALLEESEVQIITVAGYPHGANDSDVKRYETEAAVDNGAHEIEVNVNPGWVKESENARILRELRDVIEAAEERPVGAVIDAPFYSREEITRIAQIASEAGVQAIVLSTAAHPGASLSPEDIGIVQAVAEPKIKIKVSARIPDSEMARRFLQAGAARLGIAEIASLLPGQ
jgi:deoxyribose-phosphate aldolase